MNANTLLAPQTQGRSAEPIGAVDGALAAGARPALAAAAYGGEAGDD